MAAIDRLLYLGNATQHRYTSATVSVPRIFGKIALEEHVGTSIWAKYNFTPPGNAVVGIPNRPPTLVGKTNFRDPVFSTQYLLAQYTRHDSPP